MTLLNMKVEKLEAISVTMNPSSSNSFLEEPMDTSSQTQLLVSTSKLSDGYLENREMEIQKFQYLTGVEQVDYVKHLLVHMSSYQQGQVNEFLAPVLKRDFISRLPRRGLFDVAEAILSYLDASSLSAAELVSKDWNGMVSSAMLWKKLIERNVRNNNLWRGLAERNGWIHYLFKTRSESTNPGYYRALYPKFIRSIERVQNSWSSGTPKMQIINCHSQNSKGVYCLQYDQSKIISGLRDNTIKIWDREGLHCKEVLSGHTGSVLCLQYNDNVIISGSSDSTFRIWDVKSGVLLNTMIHHREAVLHLRFKNNVLVTCSKDRSLAVWDFATPTTVNFRNALLGHGAAVNVVDLDKNYIVSASGDRTIKVWNTSTCQYIRTIRGHSRGIACLQYRDRLIVSGSSDNTIRLWNVESGTCLRVLEGHEDLVRCIRFDDKRIISGAYDGKIKIWNLEAALDPAISSSAICVRTLVKHTGRVFRLEFDEFQIVSASHDDTIIVWDFLQLDEGEE